MNIFDSTMAMLRSQAAQINLPDADIEYLAREISQRIQQRPDLMALPDSLVLDALRPTIQLVLAREHSSIANVAQYAISVLVTQVAEDPNVTIPEQYRSSNFCPYPGLKAFSQSETAFFHGRDAEIDAFMQYLKQPLIAVTGPSGVGKSSFVYAGILPHLGKRYQSTARFLTFRISATNNLLGEFALFLSTETGISVANILQSINQRDDALLEILGSLRKDTRQHVFLILDQFEELFVSDNIKKQRQRLLDNLLTIEKQAPSHFLTVILTTRKNFLEHPDYTSRANLVDAIDQHDVALRAFNDQQLRQAIEQPLAVFNTRYAQDIKFQQGLIDIIIKDFRNPSVSLPLVQYLLRLMWIEKHHLSHFAYNSLGKLDRTLDRHASDVYASFADTQKLLVDRILLDLVRFGVEGEHTRKHILRQYLIRRKTETAQVQEVLKRLSDERSRIISEQSIGGVNYVELTHEVILKEWSLLRNLIEAHKDRIRQREQLLVTAELWYASRTHQQPKGDASYLYRGSSLKLAQRYISEEQDQHDSDNRIIACFEASRQWQRKNRVQTLAAIAIGLVTIILIIIVLQQRTIRERQRADTNATAQASAQQQADANATAQVLAEQQAATNARAKATAQAQAVAEQHAKEQQASVALSRKLAALSREMLRQKIDVALLLSVEAYQIQATFEAKSSLLAGLQLKPYLITFLKTDNSPIDSIAFSPDGKLLASAGREGPIRLWDVATHQLISELSIGSAQFQRNVVFSPNGKILASFSNDGIILWDVATKQQMGPPLSGNSLPINCIVFNPKGDVLVSGGGDLSAFFTRGEITKGEILFWDVTNHQILGAPLPNVENPVRRLAFSPDGIILASAMVAPGSVVLWKDRIGQPLGNADIYFGEVYSLTFSPDGKVLAVGSGDRFAAAGEGFVALWDVDTRQLLGSEIANDDKSVDTLAFSPDSKQLLSNGGLFHQQNVVLWNVDNLKVFPDPKVSSTAPVNVNYRAFQGNSSLVRAVAFGPDGKIFASGDENGNIVLWNATVTEGLSFGDLALGKPLKLGDVLYGGTEDDQMDQDNFDNYHFSQDDKLLIGVSANEIRAWDIVTGERVDTSHLDLSETKSYTEIVSSKNGIKIIAGDYNNANENTTLWDLDTGQMLGIFNARARNLALSHDEKKLISYGFPSHAYLPHPAFLWDIDIKSWKSRACKIANRNLTQTEWKEYLPGQPYRKTCKELP